MVFELDPDDYSFPKPALAEADGLLAIGGDLSTDRLLTAYYNGIFPWYSEDTPILWYAPHERFVLDPQEIKISKSMSKVLRTNTFHVTYNKSFDAVIDNCSSVARVDQDGTWIVDDMKRAYKELHRLGFAHSIEVWHGEELVGGLYGILVGKVFCGESMFAKVSNASKVALIYLCQSFDLELIDCQIHSEHLESMGAKTIESSEFYAKLGQQLYDQHGLQRLFRHP
ncbi:leucyl/phenylalanyl-tRNA--protein transferase [Sphingobacterium rhinopitheci]|uniref:leucyl/phenylalanyl-tRNA--protein transferase n=1 Tax=Sphingobacterium rhinopitheci TaxID=2781960 RepID=UPI001F528603|nr:leucyl/phenylalanyl-tRNA--protein transferase [Sphingobacterium rhinopitheci]MCI0922183.1 leucyl/phenylalanyl-tRNA--protein transferase [Sphingobacterium rhinopitheci]